MTFSIGIVEGEECTKEKIMEKGGGAGGGLVITTI